jgi:hypothetical protein
MPERTVTGRVAFMAVWPDLVGQFFHTFSRNVPQQNIIPVSPLMMLPADIIHESCPTKNKMSRKSAE